MIFETSNSARQMFWGNLLMMGCCAFYLLWWIVVFRPTDAIKGLKSGWLLIPAFLLGIAAVALIIRGANGKDIAHSFFSARTVLLIGAVSYAVLLIMTQIAFHRQVTTELLLIVGWTALAFLEINALYGLGMISRNGALALFAAAVMVAVLSMICYVLYYGLGARAGYIDGMLPLILVAIYMAALAVFIAHARN